jgi:DeoR family glycerol-3-phosphate regulon repressor
MMKPDERREKIAAVVRETSRASVDELARMLDISRETVRRDLTLLSEQGLLRKVHGGAVQSQTAREGSLRDREASNRPQKIAIGRRAAQLFENGDSIFIDAGTTTTLFAAALAEIGGFTVMTNSVPVAGRLTESRLSSEVYLLGGRYSAENQEVLGPLALEQIGAFRADHAVLAIGAMELTGKCMNYNEGEAFVAKAMLRQARSRTVLLDSSKFGRHALFEVCEPSAIDRLITDLPPPPPLARALEQAGVEVIIAG